MKKCSICYKDISHKKSNNSSKCEKCVRRLNEKSLNKIKNRTKNMHSVKKEIFNVYDISCRICGWFINTDKIQRGCEIHHIIPVNKGGKDVFENCILLCPNHHKEADLGIIDKNDLLKLISKNKKEEAIEKSLKLQEEAFKLIENIFNAAT
jgi:predicted restriction endonuclease